MESKNLVTFKLPTTAYCRLGAAIVSKSQQGQKEYFVRDTELEAFSCGSVDAGQKLWSSL